jgi:hypothetical protein
MPHHSRMSQMLNRRRELAPTADVRDVRDEEWAGFCDELDELMADPDVGWAVPTLLMIQTDVFETRQVTDRQRADVEHIATSRRVPWRVWRVRSST